MSTGHHGGDAKKHLDEVIRRFVSQGDGSAPREYPDGRMGADDEGALAFAVGTDARHGTVVVNFNKPVAWFGMSPDDAVRLASLLVKHARSVSKSPLTVDL
jgi:hypothetical protein